MATSRLFQLLLNRGTSLPLVIHANQFDENERWIFSVYDDTGTKFIPERASIYGCKADGYAIANECEVNSNGDVVVSVTKQMTAVAGKNEFELNLNGVHGTANFIVDVEKCPIDDNSFYSDSDISMINRSVAMASTNDVEIRDARTGTDGVTYSSLGEAVREQISDLQEQVNSLDPVDIATELATKVDKVQGKALSSNDFTDELKTKLENIDDSGGGGNAFGRVKVGENEILSTASDDTIELIAGRNVTMTPSIANKNVTINSDGFTQFFVDDGTDRTFLHSSDGVSFGLEQGGGISLNLDTTGRKVTISSNATAPSNALMGQGYGVCNSYSTDSPKRATLTEYQMKKGGIVSILFNYAVSAGAELSVNGMTTLPIYYNNAPIVDNIILGNDIATFICDGSRYHLIALQSPSQWRHVISTQGGQNEVLFVKGSDRIQMPTRIFANGVQQAITNGKVDLTIPICNRVTKTISAGGTSASVTLRLLANTPAVNVKAYTFDDDSGFWKEVALDTLYGRNPSTTQAGDRIGVYVNFSAQADTTYIMFEGPIEEYTS